MKKHWFPFLFNLFLVSGLLVGCSGLPTQSVSTPQAPGLVAPSDTPVLPTATVALPSPTSTETMTPQPSSTAPPPTAEGPLLSLNVLKMFTTENGWAVDDQGRVYHTSAGITQFQDVTPAGLMAEGVTRQPYVDDYLDANQAWVVASQTSATTPQVTIWYTGDGGQTWQDRPPLPGLMGGDQLNPINLYFIDASHGWYLGQIYPGMNHVYSVLFRTEDGGVTWQQVSDTLPDIQHQGGLPGSYSIPYGRQLYYFVDAQHGVAGDNSYYVTQDGGANWIEQTLPEGPNFPQLEQPSLFVQPPVFVSAEQGLVLMDVYDYINVACPPCDLFQGLPAALYLYQTADGGNSWSVQTAPAAIGDAGYVDAHTIWFLGRSDAAQTTTTLYRSEDLGVSWSVVAQDTPLPLGTQIKFVDALHGFAINPAAGRVSASLDLKNTSGGDPYFYQTTDGGQTWQPVQARSIQ